MDSLKRAFKGVFKRKKVKQEQESSATAQHKLSKTEAPQTAQAIKAEQRASSKPKESYHIPPAHPLATGEHEEPQEAVRQNYVAKTASVPEPTIAGRPVGDESDAAKQLSDEADRAFGGGDATGRNEVKSSPEKVASERRVQTMEPAKVDGAADAVRAAPFKAAAPAPAVTDLSQAHTTSTAEKLDPASATSVEHEDIRPNGTSTAGIPMALTTDEAVDPGTPVGDRASSALQARPDYEDKIPVMSEPPSVRTARTAPGMSATSGPLEDFPEGEFR